MKLLYLTPLQSIDVNEQARGFAVADNVYITSDRAFIEKLITTRFRTLAGLIDTKVVLDAPAVLYRIAETAETVDVTIASASISTFLGAAQQMLMSLWLVKDTAVMVGDGFMEFPYKSDLHGNTEMMKHNLGLYYWDARLEKSAVSFSTNELRQARRFLHTFTPRINAPRTGTPQVTLPAQTPRVARVWYFTENARMAADLAVKVATYITALEALLSTDSQELSHKLSERVARFLGGPPADQRKIFANMKAAYGVRSKTVHGDELSKKQLASLPETAATLDELLRRSLRKVLDANDLLEKFNGSKDQLDEYMLELLFASAAG